MEKQLLIDASGLLFIKTSTDLDLRISDILKLSGIKKHRMFLKKNINNKKPVNKRYVVEEDLIKRYGVEIVDDVKSEINSLYKSNKDKYVVATLRGELFSLLGEGVHFDYFYKRNYYIKL